MIEVKLAKVTRRDWPEMQAWCREHFGPPAWWKKQLDNANSPVKWVAYSEVAAEGKEEEAPAVFHFRDDKDATLFSLRWSSADTDEKSQ